MLMASCARFACSGPQLCELNLSLGPKLGGRYAGTLDCKEGENPHLWYSGRLPQSLAGAATWKQLGSGGAVSP